MRGQRAAGDLVTVRSPADTDRQKGLFRFVVSTVQRFDPAEGQEDEASSADVEALFGGRDRGRAVEQMEGLRVRGKKMTGREM